MGNKTGYNLKKMIQNKKDVENGLVTPTLHGYDDFGSKIESPRVRDEFNRNPKNFGGYSPAKSVQERAKIPHYIIPSNLLAVCSLILNHSIDLDPCAVSRLTPLIPARTMYTRNGLNKPLFGNVLLFPHFRDTQKWYDKIIREYTYISKLVGIFPSELSFLDISPKGFPYYSIELDYKEFEEYDSGLRLKKDKIYLLIISKEDEGTKVAEVEKIKDFI